MGVVAGGALLAEVAGGLVAEGGVLGSQAGDLGACGVQAGAESGLHLDGDRVTEARHCVVCQPHGPVIDVSCCCCCGTGPLITGQPPEPGAQLAAPALDWMHSRGWQLHPRPLCPEDHR